MNTLRKDGEIFESGKKKKNIRIRVEKFLKILFYFVVEFSRYRKIRKVTGRPTLLCVTKNLVPTPYISHAQKIVYRERFVFQNGFQENDQ